MEPQLVAKSAGALSDKYRLHLKILADSGLVHTQKCGRCVRVVLNRAAVRELAAFLGGLG
jgi:hypothetical protein